MDLISFLITLLVLALIIWLIILGVIPIPQPFKNVAMAIIGVLFLIYLIEVIFGQATLPVFYHRP